MFANSDTFAPGGFDADATAHGFEVLDRNWQTTTAIGLSVATGGITGGLMLAAFPAQTLVAGTAIGGLAVAGHRRHNGKDPMFGLMARFEKKEDEKQAEESAEASTSAA